MAASKLLRLPRKLTGFSKTSNVFLFLLTVGVFSIFCTWQLTYLRKRNWTRWAAPKSAGEWYWWSKEDSEGWILRVGMQVHLWSVVPAGILLPLQFLPIMRRKYMYAHKLAGRALFIALIIGNITAIMILKRSFGGTIDTHVFAYFLAASTTIGIFKSWISIRNLHIDQHRRWVLRTWAWACSILSLRIAMYPIVISLEKFVPNGYKWVHSCAEISYIYAYKSISPSSIPLRYPACSNLTTDIASSTYVVVTAHMSKQYPEQMSAMFNLVFGASGVAGFLVNVWLVEWYLSATREEDERLRKYSEGRRRKAGLEVEGEKGEKES